MFDNRIVVESPGKLLKTIVYNASTEKSALASKNPIIQTENPIIEENNPIIQNEKLTIEEMRCAIAKKFYNLPTQKNYYMSKLREIEVVKEVKGNGKGRYVHLSKDRDTAVKVGSRHGKPVLYIVKSGEMSRDGFPFYLSKNGVWLTKEVPVKYLEKICCSV